MIIKGKIEQQISFKTANEVKSVCQSMFNSSELNYFGYFRIYKSRELAGVLSDARWYEYFITHGYCYQNSKQLQPGVHLWSNTWDSSLLQEARDYYNYEHGLYIVSEYKDYTESCVFATRAGNYKILEFYLNNIIALKQFILYFKEQTKDLIKQADKQRVIIPGGLAQTKQVITANARALTSGSQPIKFQASTIHGDIKLTQQELQVIAYLCQGYTAKVIGKQMNLSPRTIEYYQARIRKKLHCISKQQLIEFARKHAMHLTLNEIVDYYDKNN